MAWTYSESLPTNRDTLRLTIGDTDSGDPLLSDETLDALLVAKNGDVALTAVDAVRAIIAKLGREFDRNAVGISGNRSQKVQHFHDLLSELTKNARLTTGVIMGGASIDRKNTINDDDDFQKPAFSIGMDDSTSLGDKPIKRW